jgi:hypothetical protein
VMVARTSNISNDNFMVTTLQYKALLNIHDYKREDHNRKATSKIIFFSHKWYHIIATIYFHFFLPKASIN